MFIRKTGGALGYLDSAQIARLDAVVARAKASADEAASLQPGVLQNAWASLIGADSSAAAIRSNAAAAQSLYEALAAKRNRLVADPNADESDVVDMEGTANSGALDNTVVRQGADQLGPGAFIDQVVVQSAEDAANAVSNPFGIPLWVWAAGGLALFIALKARR